MLKSGIKMIRSQQQANQQPFDRSNSTSAPTGGTCSVSGDGTCSFPAMTMDSTCRSSARSMAAVGTTGGFSCNVVNDGVSAMQQYHRSLPLKKRRFHKITLYHNQVNANSSNDCTISTNSSCVTQEVSTNDPSFIQEQKGVERHHHLQEIGNFEKNSADEKFAALALVAAATATSNTNKQVDISIHDNNGKCITASTTPTAAAQQKARVIHPPLYKPIPGGCHGRTSRNNSYCRRTPCYNGSNYCKLHFQQYTNKSNQNGNRDTMSTSPDDNNKDNNSQDIQSDVKVTLKGTTKLKGESNTNDNGMITTQPNATSAPGRSNQDKRYTGLITGELQCLATTTRGRPCSYVAVAKTKYCHLHADYDTNPPPRRGGGCGGSGGGLNKAKSTVLNSTSECLKVQERTNVSTRITPALTGVKKSSPPPNTTSIAMKTSLENNGKSDNEESTESLKSQMSFPTTTISQESKAQTIPTGHENGATIPKTISTTVIHPPPPYPCLNAIPSDQWSNRYVLIGAGPLVNHIGCVLKWGNGWVTISMKTGLCNNLKGKIVDTEIMTNEILHNRRATELYVLPDDLTTVTDLPFPVRAEPVTRQVASTSTSLPTVTSNPGVESKTIVPRTILSTLKEEKSNSLPKHDQENHNPSITEVKKIETTTRSNERTNTTKESEDMNSTKDGVSEKLRDDSPISNDGQKCDKITSGVDAISMESINKTFVGNAEIQKVNKVEGDAKASKIDLCKNDEKGNIELSLGSSSSILKKKKGNKVANDSRKRKSQSLSNDKDDYLTNDKSLQGFVVTPVEKPSSKSTSARKRPRNSNENKSDDPTKQSKKVQDSESNYERKWNQMSSLSSKEVTTKAASPQMNEDQKSKKKLTFIEELVLAQTGRRLKNVNLLLDSPGGRTIQKPTRYEDKTLIKKKKQRQNQDNEEDCFIQRKQDSSPAVNSPKAKSSRSFTDTKKTNSKLMEASKNKRPLNVPDVESDHRVGKIKAS